MNLVKAQASCFLFKTNKIPDLSGTKLLCSKFVISLSLERSSTREGYVDLKEDVSLAKFMDINQRVRTHKHSVVSVGIMNRNRSAHYAPESKEVRQTTPTLAEKTIKKTRP